jgi:adenine-specific DNA-methyltransferase
MATQNPLTVAHWANQFGLAVSPLFGPSDAPTVGDHFAMLDGRRGSFAWSSGDALNVSQDDSRSWRWSSDLSHHVIVTPTKVVVDSGTDESRAFERSSVDDHLDQFFQFLETPRKASLPDVVPFLVEEFLRLWATAGAEREQGETALAAFLVALLAAGEPDPGVFEEPAWRTQQATELGLNPDLVADTPPLTIEWGVGMRTRTPLNLRLAPSLVLRHAAGRLFQEAHAYLVRQEQLGLFGDVDVRFVPTFAPSGAYFTPVPIARLLAEAALQQRANLPNPLTIADYACGSGVFLSEALRVLGRVQYAGSIRLVGRDISEGALTMSRVAIRTVLRDLPHLDPVVDLARADATELRAWPTADVVLMNPPFRSWESMSSEHRSWVQGLLGGRAAGRPDLSVGFVTRALETLSPSGMLATLVPAGVLASDSLTGWRKELLSQATPTMLAVLGEHDLFRHALVNVGVLVVAKGQRAHQPLTVAWASSEQGAASGALRAIRRSRQEVSVPTYRSASPGRWAVTRISVEALSERPSWLPGAGALGPLLDSLRSRIQTRVQDLFDVRQGIRTGHKDVFLQTKGFVAQLPADERRFFAPAVTTPSFVNGNIEVKEYVFVADPAWNTEADVHRACPQFFERILHPAKHALKSRKGIQASHWWQLTRARKWSADKRPRLVSKRFGLLPAFARDLDGAMAVVQANAWFPTRELLRTPADGLIREVLKMYWWLLNSRVTVALLREYCPNVAGGQLDLEHKYVRHLPLPNLAMRINEDLTLQSLATNLSAQGDEVLPSLEQRDLFAAAAFGTELADWPDLGLTAS